MITEDRKIRIMAAYNTHTDKYDDFKKDLLYHRPYAKYNPTAYRRYKYAKRRMKRRLAMIHRLEMLYPDLCMR